MPLFSLPRGSFGLVVVRVVVGLVSVVYLTRMLRFR